MKKVSFLVLTLLLLAQPTSALIIVEVQIAGDQSDHDYVKIYNSQDREIEVNSYRLRKKSASGKDYSLRLFPQGTVIPAQSYLTWANSREGFADNIQADLSSTATLAINNSVALINSDGQVVSAVAWGQGQDQYQEGYSRLPNPEAHQLIKRKNVDGVYQASQSNFDDFYLTELPISNSLLSFEESTPLRRQSAPWLNLILLAVAISLVLVKIFNIYYQKKIIS